jgi:toxin ParE1/3/4
LRSLRKIRQCIASGDQAAANTVIDRIEQTIARLSTFPQCGRAGIRAGTLEVVIPGTPFVVAYRLQPDEVQVLRIFNGKQPRHRSNLDDVFVTIRGVNQQTLHIQA